eukprot:GCRY01001089.1.p1 GENE.GCRY01001089.1~~GCRY01001089.1.p1  ORF type:complete len:341 (+),score=58.19 GCRY01001089.1:180-1202(+)
MGAIFIFIVVVTLWVTGVAQPLILDLIKYAGAGDTWGLLYLYPNYVGMALLFFYPRKLYDKLTSEEESLLIGKKKSVIKEDFKQIWRIIGSASLDFFSYSLCLIGLSMAGSMIYTIIYASVTTFTALLSRLFLKARLNALQWLGVAVVTVGLMTSGFAVSSAGSGVIYGAAFVFVGTIGHSSMYVVNDFLIGRATVPIHSVRLCTYVGWFSISLMTIYLGVYTVPHWGSVFVRPIEDKGASFAYVWFLYFWLLVADLLHALVFYYSLGAIGAVTTGVIKGATAVTVFVAGAVSFCDSEKNQCMTDLKLLSLILTVSGVLIYSYGKRRRHQPAKIGEVDIQ